jgi:ribosomal protein S18 acetylase RimI-like enzyme
LTLRLRAAKAEDDAFLRRVYAGTRAEELARVPWSEAEKEAFLAMQFEAQDRHYRACFPGTRFDVIEQDGVPIGRLYVQRTADEIRILDIALLPAHRGAGAGGALLRELLREAAASARRVTIHVERTNPALRLYARLGFRVEADDDAIYLFMAWRPEAQEKTAS